MAEVHSTFELRRGALAPDFELPEGGAKKKHNLQNLADGKKAIVVIFACNHCPYVFLVADLVGEFAKDYAKREVQFVAINANDVSKNPEDAPNKMKDFAKEHGWKFPYLYDEDQSVAKSYSAACTPDFFVFNGDLELTYAGQFDNARPGNATPATGADLRAALESTLRSGKADSVRMRPSSGCNIKWKKGNAPAYFS